MSVSVDYLRNIEFLVELRKFANDIFMIITDINVYSSSLNLTVTE